MREDKPKCVACHKRTKSMYALNDGIYCENHVQVALTNQKFLLDMNALSERINSFKWYSDVGSYPSN